MGMLASTLRASSLRCRPICTPKFPLVAKWRLRATVHHQRICKTYFTSGLPATLVPPTVFCGLLITLWTYKCIMMIIFQNKIIYMPGLPLGARKERLADYARQCQPVRWEEKRIKAADGVEIALCIGKTPITEIVRPRRHIVIVYFQGNASSLPPRLPSLSRLLRRDSDDPDRPDVTLVAMSYRGYWLSQGRPSQRGIELDAAATLDWIQQHYSVQFPKPVIILWGQSIGSGVATVAAQQWLTRISSIPNAQCQLCQIRGLILETPFISMRDMLVALYPQKWLPYRYLWPFLRNHWDSRTAISKIGKSNQGENEQNSPRLKILILQAGKDELVPSEHADELKAICIDAGLDVTRVKLQDALHSEVLTKAQSYSALWKFVKIL